MNAGDEVTTSEATETVTQDAPALSVLWDQMVQTMSDLKKDFDKNTTKHNVSAGVRVRKGLRELRKQASLLMKETLVADKETIDRRKTENASKKSETPTE